MQSYLSLLNSFLFLSRFSVSLKSLDNYFFRWFAYKSLLSRFSVLISYNMWSSNHFSISSHFPCFSGSRFSGSGSGSRDRVQVLEAAHYTQLFCKKKRLTWTCSCLTKQHNQNSGLSSGRMRIWNNYNIKSFHLQC